MSSGVLRYEVPVDDQWHPIAYSGTIGHVGSRRTGCRRVLDRAGRG
jgi:hypothetical protein